MKIAVLGLGFMGSTHLKALQNLPQVEVVAVASEDERQLSGDLTGVQGNIGGPGARMDFSALRKYRDWREAVADPLAEAVDICLPTNLHAPATIAALRAGKHALVEKPMALSGAEADAMLEAAHGAGRILMVAQVLRFFPEYQALAALVKSGRLGTVRAAMLRRRCAAPGWSAWLSDKRASGGGIFDLMVHDVDMCLHLFGPPGAITATGHEDLARGIDWIAAQFHYPGMAVAMAGGWHPSASFPFSMEYSIVADGGVVEYSSAGVPPVQYLVDGSKIELPLAAQDGYQAEVEYFVECCIQHKSPALCPPAESAAAVKLACLMIESRKKNGERIAWKSE